MKYPLLSRLGVGPALNFMLRPRNLFLAVLATAVIVPIAFVILRPCVEMRVLIINGTSDLTDVIVSRGGRTVWAGNIGYWRTVEIWVAGGGGEFTLEARDDERGRRYWARTRGAGRPFTWQKVFLIDYNRTVTANLSAPDDHWAAMRAAADHIGCLDRRALAWLKGVLAGRQTARAATCSDYPPPV